RMLSDGVVTGSAVHLTRVNRRGLDNGDAEPHGPQAGENSRRQRPSHAHTLSNHKRKPQFSWMKTLVIDVGGTNVKLLATGQREPVKIPSGPKLTPSAMVDKVLDATDGWQVDNISIGFPSPVVRGRIAREPHNLGRGWVRFNFEKAF